MRLSYFLDAQRGAVAEIDVEPMRAVLDGDVVLDPRPARWIVILDGLPAGLSVTEGIKLLEPFLDNVLRMRCLTALPASDDRGELTFAVCVELAAFPSDATLSEQMLEDIATEVDGTAPCPLYPDARVCSFVATAPASCTALFESRTVADEAPVPREGLASPTLGPSDPGACAICLDAAQTLPCVTIICGHTFHIHCFSRAGPSCPLCRFDLTVQASAPNRFAHMFRSVEMPREESYDSSAAHAADDRRVDSACCSECVAEPAVPRALWMCLTCGGVLGGSDSCGHGAAHFRSTGHRFAIDVHAPRVWDYVCDAYVHRIVQELRAVVMEGAPEEPAEDLWATDDANDDLERAQLASAVDFVADFYSKLLEDQLRAQGAHFERELAAISADLVAGDACGDEEDERAAIAADESRAFSALVASATASVRAATFKVRRDLAAVLDRGNESKPSDAGLAVNTATLEAAWRSLELIRSMRAGVDAKAPQHKKAMAQKRAEMTRVRSELEALYAQL